MKNWVIYILLIFATSSWGSAFIAGKFAVESFGPSTVAFLRFFGAMILLFPIMWIFDKHKPKITKKDWGLFAILGLTGIAIYNICFFLASVHAPVIKSSLFIATNPIVIAIFSGIFLKETITKNHIIGMIIALSGAFIIITNGQFQAFFEVGFQQIDIVLMIAVLSWALYSVIGKIVLNKFSPITSTTYAVAFGTLLLLPFAIMETSWTTITEASLHSWIAIVYMNVVVTVISFIIYYKGIQKVGAAKAAIFINFMPLSAVIMATIILDESLQIVHFIGAMFILFGVYYGTKSKTKSIQSNT